MYQRLSAHELRSCLKVIYCDQLLFGCGAPPSADDIFNAHYGKMDVFSTEFSTAIQSIANDISPNDIYRIYGGESLRTNGTTYDWNEATQDFSIRAYEEKDVIIDVVQPLATKTVAQKLLRKAKIKEYCVFCRNNGEPEYVYNSHPIRDIYNRILCSRLRSYECPICRESGDNAHTIKYCPKKPILTMDEIKARDSRKPTN